MRRTAELGLMLALALILSYVESLIPFSFGIPGIKLGLPNLIVLLLLCEKAEEEGTSDGFRDTAGMAGTVETQRAKTVKFLTKGEREALLVNGLRIVLSGFLFSSLYTILYALAGAAFSFAAMVIGRRTKRFSMADSCGNGGGGNFGGGLVSAVSAGGGHGDGRFAGICGDDASALFAAVCMIWLYVIYVDIWDE